MDNELRDNPSEVIGEDINEDSKTLELQEYTLLERQEFTRRVTQLKELKESGSISQEEYERGVLNSLGVEVSQEGDLILYHVTTAEFLPAILSNRLIKPAIETGATVLRTPREEASIDELDLDKKRKIYLATKREAVGIARGINRPSRVEGGTYIFEVKVKKDHLVTDEDSKEETWVDSLGKVATCAYRGSIAQFEILGRVLPVPENYYELKDKIKASSGTEKLNAQKEYDDQVVLIDKQFRDNIIGQVGFDTNSVPVIR
jgi:hypothetical protein